MKKSTAPCRARLSGAPQPTAKDLYARPEMEIIELEQEQYILTGSNQGEVQDYGDGGTISYLPTTDNRVNNA